MERKEKKQSRKKEISNKSYTIYPLIHPYQIGALSSVTDFAMSMDKRMIKKGLRRTFFSFPLICLRILTLMIWEM